MSMASQNAGGSGRRKRRSRHHTPISEINVTPFVDVMLVLLIVFMVAAPLLTVGVPIDLPETGAKPLNAKTQPITISVDDTGKVYLQETEIPRENLLARLKVIAQNGYKERIFFRIDKTTDYGYVMKVMALVSAAGYQRIGLVTEPEQEQEQTQ